MRPDLVIQGGTVVDGSGGEPYVADVSLNGDRISEIGQIGLIEGATNVDASGLIVSPGFIDIHSHSDFTLLVDPRAISAISQGVTLEIVGNCGRGCAPVKDIDRARTNMYGYQPDHDIPWTSVSGYLDHLESKQPAINVATLVANGCLRNAVMNDLYRPASATELKSMKSLLSEGIEQGAVGYSTGLECGIEGHATEEEIVELCRIAAEADVFYATHTRNVQGQPVETIAEAIRAGQASGVDVQISHIGCISRLSEDVHGARSALEQAIEQVDRAHREGQNVGFDMHTRLFGMTNLSCILPSWTTQGTVQQTLAQLNQSRQRQKMRDHQSVVTALAHGGWTHMELYNIGFKPQWNRRSIQSLSDEWNLDPFDTVCEVLRQAGDNLHTILILGFVYRPEDTHFVFEHPLCMVGSDATTMACDAHLKSTLLHGAFTWAAWFYRYFVRDTHKLTVQEFVRRLTTLPAERLKLADRGALRKGYFGDIAIFDPETFQERGTIDEPQHAAVGMQHVLVNGQFVVKDTQVTGTRSGQVLRS